MTDFEVPEVPHANAIPPTEQNRVRDVESNMNQLIKELLFLHGAVS